jgi:hypothetical protein
VPVGMLELVICLRSGPVHSSTEPNPIPPSDPDDEEQPEDENSAEEIELQEVQLSDSGEGTEGPAQEQEDRPNDADQAPTGPPNLVDALGVEDLTLTYVRFNGREFAAAGRKIPVAEIDYFGMVMYHPEMPLSTDAEQLISVEHDEQDVVLDELGQRRKIAGARYKGHAVFWHREVVPNTTRHYVVWFDDDKAGHSLFLAGQRLTVDIVLKMRARTVNGELSVFGEVTTD